jgi:hypothetical protein
MRPLETVDEEASNSLLQAYADVFQPTITPYSMRKDILVAVVKGGVSFKGMAGVES